MTTAEEIKKWLQRDPLVHEFLRIQVRRHPFALRTPVEALAQKRTMALMALSGFYKTKHDNGETTELSAEALLSTAKVFLSSQVLFLNEGMGQMLTAMERKVKESYGDGTNLPSEKSLPFPFLWLSGTGGGARGYEATVIFSAEGERRMVGISGSNENGGTIYGTPHTLRQYTTDAIALFLEEKIATIRKELPPRQFRKAIQGSGLADESIHVIELRAIDASKRTNPNTGEVVSEVEWRRRWLVRGHVRNQWFPSKGTNEIIWIDPYVKGPESAPFIETVRHVVR